MRMRPDAYAQPSVTHEKMKESRARLSAPLPVTSPPALRVR